MTGGALWRRFVRHKALIHEQICQCQHILSPRTRILRRVGAYARKKTTPSFPLSTYLSAEGTGASLNKRLIIHPDLNNRHSPTIVSFPYESPRRARLKIVCASITYVYTRSRYYNYSLRSIANTPAGFLVCRCIYFFYYVHNKPVNGRDMQHLYFV